MVIDVRAARLSDLGAIRRTLVAAFDSHPLRRFLLPGARRRRLAISTGDLALLLEGLAYGTVLVAVDTDRGRERLLGVLAWLPPASYPRPRWRTQLLTLTRLPYLFCPPIGWRARGFQRAIEVHHPREPALYPTLAAVRPEAQGLGIGSALLRRMTAIADAAAQVAFLETTNPRNVPLYERHGFVVTARYAPIDPTLEVVTMVRPVRSPSVEWAVCGGAGRRSPARA